MKRVSLEVPPGVEASDGFRDALMGLLQNWAFEPSRQRPCLPIYQDEAKSCTVENLRRLYLPSSYVEQGPRGGEGRSGSQQINVTMSRLRSKLSHVEGGPQLIRTVRYEGYLLAATVERVSAD